VWNVDKGDIIKDQAADLNFSYLAVNKRCNSHIPSGVGGHSKSKKRPHSIVVKWRNEHGGGTAGSKNISPCPLVKFVIYVVYIAVITPIMHSNQCIKQIPFFNKYWKSRKDKLQNRKGTRTDLAQAISCITEPNMRKVQLKANPTAFQAGPSNPSSTSNHCRLKILTKQKWYYRQLKKKRGFRKHIRIFISNFVLFLYWGLFLEG